MLPLTETGVVVATHNAGKLREFASMLGRLRIRTIPAARLGLPQPEETGRDFAENALIKAQGATRIAGMPAIADDSGLSVDALGGAPGVHTADWTMTPSGRDYPRAMARLWRLLEEASAPEPMTARFFSVICLAGPDGDHKLFEGSVAGRITWPPRGEGGFGFDQVFQPDGHGQTFAEMETGRKNRISHRARALEKLMEYCRAG